MLSFHAFLPLIIYPAWVKNTVMYFPSENKGNKGVQFVKSADNLKGTKTTLRTQFWKKNFYCLKNFMSHTDNYLLKIHTNR